MNQNFLKSFLASKAANIKNVDALIRVNDAFAPEDVCNTVAHALPEQFNGNVWFEVLGKPERWSLPVNDRIHYLENLTKACKDHGLKPGMFSNRYDWTFTMGCREKGSDILGAIPLWYLNQDGKANFDDFGSMGFGSWEKPQMKNYQLSTYICNYMIWNVNFYSA